MQQLRDIKGIVEISDNSFLYLFGISVVIVLLFIAFLLYFRLRKKRIRRKFKKSASELAKERIENIDYNDPKNVAYTFIEDVGKFIDQKKREEFKDIVKELEPYKYKKEVPSMDDILKSRIKDFIKEIRWQI